MLIALLTLLGLAVFVSASMTLLSKPDTLNTPDYEVDVYLFKGWNLVAGVGDLDLILPDSEIQEKDIIAVYSYIPSVQDYARVLPYDKMESDKINLLDDDQFFSSSFWVYSKEPGRLKFRTETLWLKDRLLFSGWNFLSITPNMIGQGGEPELRDFAGTCNLEKAYFFNPEQQEWVVFPLNEDFSEDASGLGILIKVSNNCNMENVGDGDVPPPSIPN